MDTPHRGRELQPSQRKAFQVKSFNNFFKKYKRKRKAGLLSLSDTAYFLLSLRKPPITHEWALQCPQTSLNFLSVDSSAESNSVWKVLKHRCDDAQIQPRWMQSVIKVAYCFLVWTLKRAQLWGGKLIRLLCVEFIKENELNEWQTYLTSLADRRKLCMSFLFLFSQPLWDAHLHQYMTWHIFFHFKTFALVTKNHPAHTVTACALSLSLGLLTNFINCCTRDVLLSSTIHTEVAARLAV